MGRGDVQAVNSLLLYFLRYHFELTRFDNPALLHEGLSNKSWSQDYGELRIQFCRKTGEQDDLSLREKISKEWEVKSYRKPTQVGW